MLGGALRVALPCARACLCHSGWLLEKTTRLRLAHTASARPAQSVRASKQALEPAEPATVKPYYHHMFVELPDPGGSAASEASPWWPSVVEKEPALLRVFSRLAERGEDIEGGVKVTAFQEVRPEWGLRLAKGAANVLVYPDGVRYDSIPFEQLPGLVDRHFATPLEGRAATADASQGGAEGSPAAGLQLFVCCHGTRDARCGQIGPPLARRLQTVANAAGMGEHVAVYMCSHIGGHKYAGNVLVMGAISPCDGDWYGGLRADDAESFLTALTGVMFGEDGGPADATLRKWWRGRMGLEKEEQQQFFDCKCLNVSEEEDEEDEEEVMEGMSVSLSN